MSGNNPYRNTDEHLAGDIAMLERISQMEHRMHLLERAATPERPVKICEDLLMEIDRWKAQILQGLSDQTARQWTAFGFEQAKQAIATRQAQFRRATENYLG